MNDVLISLCISIPITIGIVLLIYFSLKEKKKPRKIIRVKFKKFYLCEDEAITKSLLALHKSELGFNLSPELKSSDFPELQMEVSSENSLFFSKNPHPIIRGRIYYRGYCFSTETGKVIIFSGWMPPKSTHPPIVYASKTVPIEIIEKIVDAFTGKMGYKIGNGFTKRFFSNLI